MTSLDEAFIPPASIAQEERAFEYDELTIAPYELLCPRLVAGLECRRSNCTCITHNGLMDHARMWKDRNGNFVLTAEPYGVADKEIAAFIDDVQPLGLRVTLSGRSYWNPGDTMLIKVTRKPEEDKANAKATAITGRLRRCGYHNHRGNPCANPALSDDPTHIAICGRHAAQAMALVDEATGTR